jgi:hypothetical protein
MSFPLIGGPTSCLRYSRAIKIGAAWRTKADRGSVAWKPHAIAADLIEGVADWDPEKGALATTIHFPEV